MPCGQGLPPWAQAPGPDMQINIYQQLQVTIEVPQLMAMILCNFSVSVWISLVSVLYQLSSVSSAAASHHLLTINTFCTGEDFNSNDVLPHMEAAVDEIDGFRLDVTNSSSSITEVEALLDGLLQHPPELAAIHPGCSDSTLFLADTSNYFNTTLITYAFSPLPASTHPNHLQMLPSETHLAVGVAALMEQFSWRRIVMFSEEAPVFGSITSSLEDLIASKSTNITISKSVVSEKDLEEGVSFPEDNRIFLINAFPAMTRSILCEGYTKGMLFPSYVWITYEWNQLDWWRLSDHTHHTPSNCSDVEMENMLKGTFALSLHQTAEEGEVNTNTTFTSNYGRLAYDAIDVLARVVNQSNSSQHAFGEALDEITFHGASGPVMFRDGLRELETMNIKQYRGGGNGDFKLVTFANILTADHENFSYLPEEGDNTVWPDAEVPSDGAPIVQTNPPLLPLMILLYVYVTAGIVFAVVCLFFNFIFRNKRLIRLTSPNLNYVIILGAIIFYCSVYTFFYTKETPITFLTVVCNFRLWLTALGFSLCYGPINAKMWRVYHICHKPNPSMKKMFVKDWHLMLVVAGFVAADVVMLTVVTALGSSVRYSVRSIPDKERPDTVNSDGITVTYRVDRCYSNSEVYWLPVIIGYKLILQAIGAFLAFNIRKVKIKGLNDSREISAILYVTTIITFAITVVTFVFGDYINVDGTVYGFGIATATTCVLAFIFIPKMVGLYKDPKGEKIFSTTAAHKDNTLAGRSQVGEDKQVICALEGRIKELETELAEKKVQSPNSTLTSVDLTKETETSSLSQAE